MQKYSTAFLALKQGTEVFRFGDSDRKITFGPTGMGLISHEVPTVLIRGGSYSCFQPHMVSLISLKTLAEAFRNENPGYHYNLKIGIGVIDDFRFLYRRKFPNYVDFSLARNELDLVDIMINPDVSEIRVVVPKFSEPEILSYGDWDNLFINIAVLDYGLECAKIALGK